MDDEEQGKKCGAKHAFIETCTFYTSPIPTTIPTLDFGCMSSIEEFILNDSDTCSAKTIGE